MEPFTGKFEMVNPRHIVFDHRYQRPEKPDLIALIASAPNWAKFGCIVCARRAGVDGILYGYDGQQRICGVLNSEKPPMLVPALVFEFSFIEEEAEVFADVNLIRKSMRPYEKFRARVFHKHPVYLLIDRVAGELGFSIGEGSRNDGRTISAIGTLERIYNRSGEEGLRRVLTGISDAWSPDPAATDAQVLDALSIVLTDSNGSLDRGAVKKALARTAPGQILQEAKRLQFDLGGSKKQNIVRAIKKQTRIK